MSNLVQPINAAHPQQSQTQAAALPQKPPATPATASQDQVTISESAKQALANNAQAPTTGKGG